MTSSNGERGKETESKDDVKDDTNDTADDDKEAEADQTRRQQEAASKFQRQLQQV